MPNNCQCACCTKNAIAEQEKLAAPHAARWHFTYPGQMRSCEAIMDEHWRRVREERKLRIHKMKQKLLRKLLFWRNS